MLEVLGTFSKMDFTPTAFPPFCDNPNGEVTGLRRRTYTENFSMDKIILLAAARGKVAQAQAALTCALAQVEKAREQLLKAQEGYKEVLTSVHQEHLDETATAS